MPRPRTSSTAPRRAAVTWLALLLAAVGPACRAYDASVHNLRELHTSTGEARPSARLHTPLEYGLATTFGDAPSVSTDSDGVRRVSRPQARVLDELNRLASYRGGDRRLVAAQLDLAAFLATQSRSQVVRERAVELLAELGRRTGVASVELSPPEDPSDAAAVAAVAALIEDGAQRESLEVLAGRLLELDVDLQGARALVLRLGEQRGVSDELRESTGLAAAELDLRRRCVELAVGAALADSSEWVSAAAARASMELQPDLAYRLLAAAVRARALRQIEVCLRHALEVGLDFELADREAWIDAAAESLEIGNFFQDGPVVVAACDLLGQVAEVQLDTLRIEEWVMWFDQRRSAGDPAAPTAEAAPQ